jgi:hypothetical protein
VTAARTNAIFYANEKKDYQKAMEYVQKGKKLDANDANLLNIEKLLNLYMNRISVNTSPTLKAINSSNQSMAVKKTKTTTGKPPSGK